MTRGWRVGVILGLVACASPLVQAQGVATPSPAPTEPPAQAPTPSPTPTPSPATTPAAEPATVKVAPYGVVYFNGFNNSGGTNNQDVPLWAATGTGDTSATARQSRFGLRVSVPAVLGAKAAAVVEADFFGGFPSIGTGENFGQVRLRLAHVRLDWKNTSVVIGQDWMVFAPLSPNSLACAAIPLFAAAGNPWARLPQVRLEERFGSGLFQAAVLAPQSGDFSSAFLAQPNSGALSEVPYLQGRLALTTKNAFGSGKPGAVGISGHYGRSKVTPTGGSAKDLDSTGGALDLSLPLGKYVVIAGEAFAGKNLAGFQAAVFQGINPDAATSSAAAGTPEAIATKGGWAQVGVTPGASKVSLLAAYGIDDPDDADLKSATKRNWRTRNQVVALAVQYRASAQLSFGVEYRFLETAFLQSAKQKDRHLNLAMVVAF